MLKPTQRLCAIITMLAMMACSSAPAQSIPEFEVTTGHGDVEVRIASSQDTTIFDVTSHSGIGSFQARHTSGIMPDDIQVRLHLTGLEGLSIEYDDIRVQASVASSQPYTQSQSVWRWHPGEELWVEVPGDYALNLAMVAETSASATIPLQEGVFSFHLPEDFFARGGEQFTITWVDFYR